MKKKSFITIFITAHIVLIFLQVHKHTMFIQTSYNHQQCEKKMVTLTEKKQTLTQELYALKDRENIKKYAQNKLNMRPYTLNQVKKLHIS
jgi:cell division protein FtsL